MKLAEIMDLYGCTFFMVADHHTNNGANGPALVEWDDTARDCFGDVDMIEHDKPAIIDGCECYFASEWIEKGGHGHMIRVYVPER